MKASLNDIPYPMFVTLSRLWTEPLRLDGIHASHWEVVARQCGSEGTDVHRLCPQRRAARSTSRACACAAACPRRSPRPSRSCGPPPTTTRCRPSQVHGGRRHYRLLYIHTFFSLKGFLYSSLLWVFQKLSYCSIENSINYYPYKHKCCKHLVKITSNKTSKIFHHYEVEEKYG